MGATLNSNFLQVIKQRAQKLVAKSGSDSASKFGILAFAHRRKILGPTAHKEFGDRHPRSVAFAAVLPCRRPIDKSAVASFNWLGLILGARQKPFAESTR
jgi:hypothetical protein